MIFLNNLENNNLSPINEINMARTNGMCVSVDPSPNENYGKIAYFKAYNNSNPLAATKEIRLHFYDIGYEIHNKGLPLWKMKKSDKEKLMVLLNSTPTNKRYEKYGNVWTALIAVFNSRVKPQDVLPLDLSIPDYTKM